MRFKFIPVIIIASLLFVLYYFESNTIASYGPAKEEIAEEKEHSAFDSLIFSFDSLISSEIDSNGTVGAAIAITHKGKIAFLKCYGVRKAGENDSIDQHTVFRLASVSKSITGVLAGIMAEEKEISLDDKVIDYLPGFKLKDSVNTLNLSIRNILSHTSGLVPHAYDNLVESGVPMRTIIDSLHRVNISNTPGKLYGYQNVVFSLFDTLTFLKTSRSFNDLLTEKVFIPFGMRNASTGFQPFLSTENYAYPHTRYGKGYRTLPLNDRYYNTIPAAGINASISDLGNFLVALSDREKSHIINSITNTVLTPQVISPLKWNYLRRWDKVESKHYALGWRIIGYKGRQVAYHGGYVHGYRADIALCRDEDIGIAFLTNSPNSVASLAVPTFLNMYFDKNLVESP